MDTRENKDTKDCTKSLEESERQLRFLLDLSDKLRLLSDPAHIHEVITGETRKYFNSDRCHYGLVEGDIMILEEESIIPSMPSFVGNYDLNRSPEMKAILEKGEPLIIEDMRTNTILQKAFRESSIKQKLIAYIMIPTIKNDKLAGILAIMQSSPRKWTDFEVKLAMDIEERAWCAMERAKIQKEKEKPARDLIEELENTDKQRMDFLSSLSHELRNPLATISMGLDLMDYIEDNKEEEKALKKTLKRQTKQLARLVDDLLNMTRISQNKFELRLEELELNLLLCQVIGDSNLFFREKGITMETSLSKDKIFIEGDGVRLRQVIENILHNASKFTPIDGKVTISLKKDKTNNQAIISIKDTGQGMSREDIKDIFKPYVQARNNL